jgi:hypothetical protein
MLRTIRGQGVQKDCRTEKRSKHMKQNQEIEKREEIVKGAADLIEHGATLSQIRTTYQTAVRVQEKRDIKTIMASCELEASLAGASFYYSWKVTNKDGSKKLIDGVSINGAQTIARNFGNCAVEIAMHTEDPEITAFSRVDFTAWFIDLEKGFTNSRIYSITIQPAPGRFEKDEGQKRRWYDMQIQKGQSFAQRNVILRSVPSWLVDKVKNSAKTSALKGVKDEGLDNAVAKAIGYFKGLGVEQTTLEEYLGAKSSAWTPEEIITLRSIAQQIEDGFETVDTVFSKNEPSNENLDAEIIEHDFWELVGNKIPAKDGKKCREFIEESARVQHKSVGKYMAELFETFNRDHRETQAFAEKFAEWKRANKPKEPKGQGGLF